MKGSIKVVEAEEPSRQIDRTLRTLPTLPKEEAYRMRRATRNAVDALYPWVIQKLVALAESENEKVSLAALVELKNMVSTKPNEEVDPEETVIDLKPVGKDDPLAKLEASTENGSGKADVD